MHETLSSLFSQSTAFEWDVIICDDASGDLSSELFNSYPKKIWVYEFERNIGYPGNLQRCFELARGDYLMLLGQDDIVAPGYLQRIVDEFRSRPEIGAISRSYFWFNTNIDAPVRAKVVPVHLGLRESVVVAPSDDFLHWRLVIDSLDQLSGLAFRKSSLRSDVGSDIFTAHIVPFIEIMSRQQVCFITRYTVAVRISSSQSRHVSKIYDSSPIGSWISMIKELAPPGLKRQLLQDFVLRNSVGLIQIRNYARKPLRYMAREVGIMVRHRPQLLLDPKFLVVTILCAFTPRIMLRLLVDRLKPVIFRFRSQSVPVKLSCPKRQVA